jgi:mRNA interferase MazF
LVAINGRVPECGDIIKLQFNPQSGREQSGYRPTIVISPADYNHVSSLILVCPITNRQKSWPFEVELPASMNTTGVVLVDQLKSIDIKAREATFVEAAPLPLIDEVLARLETLTS